MRPLQLTALDQWKRIKLGRDVMHGFVHRRRQPELRLAATDPAHKERLVLDRLVDGETLGSRGAQSIDGTRPAITGRRRMEAGSKRHAQKRSERDGTQQP